MIKGSLSLGRHRNPPYPGSRKPAGVLSVLDVAAKLIAAFAVVGAAFVASTFQSSMTATNLLSQREQADSALRAGMFHDLIGQMLNAEKIKGDIPADRERLLVELLALNFHEHFELKPVMHHVDDRLAHETINGMSAGQKDEARESLRSVARRVLQRQLALLTQADGHLAPTQRACVYRVDLTVRPNLNPANAAPAVPCSTITRYFDDLISVDSPNGLYKLAFTVSPPRKWLDQTFEVSMRIAGKTADSEGRKVSADHDFLLSWFDFPFTDNTLLADGTRFALVLDDAKPNERAVSVKLVWFPQDYTSRRGSAPRIIGSFAADLA